MKLLFYVILVYLIVYQLITLIWSHSNNMKVALSIIHEISNYCKSHSIISFYLCLDFIFKRDISERE